MAAKKHVSVRPLGSRVGQNTRTPRGKRLCMTDSAAPRKVRTSWESHAEKPMKTMGTNGYIVAHLKICPLTCINLLFDTSSSDS